MNNHTYLRAFSALGLALSLPAHVHAQSMSYGGGSSADAGDDEGDTSDDKRSSRSGKKLTVTPYIEAAQVATARLSPGSDTLTYSTIAAGIDASIQGRNTKGAISARYERRIGYGNAASGDTISGVARIGTTIIPNALNIEAGALAARSQVENNGQTVLGTPVGGNSSTQIYSVYAGPTIKTRAGDVAIDGGYRIGYTKVGTDAGVITAPGGPAFDVFDHSISQNAEIHAGVKPGAMLPVGVGVGAGYYQEDISNLDQRVRDLHARADVTLPLTGDLALVGGVGYEKVQVSSRDVARDGTGAPIIGSNGRYVTDKSGPRVMSYDTSGLIWDAGVMWRPSKRTALEAHVGRRYGSMTYYGSFAYAPSKSSSINVSVYDGITGFGGLVNNALANMPTEFQAARNPLTGEITGCVVAQAAGSCLGGVLGSVRSSVFRSRGVTASYGKDLGRFQAGFGGGYDRRKFIGAPGTILALANGVTDENVWLSAYLNGRIDQQSSFATNFYSSWYQSGEASAGDFSAIGASAAYNRNLTGKLAATAALGLESISRETVDDQVTASALVGVRYSF